MTAIEETQKRRKDVTDLIEHRGHTLIKTRIGLQQISEILRIVYKPEGKEKMGAQRKQPVRKVQGSLKEDLIIKPEYVEQDGKFNTNFKDNK